MKGYFAYTRVSTVKQGEKGSSLQEQKAAIEAYARRHNLDICEWFEEQETAAKQGRTIFAPMVRRLEGGEARGVITHKIDRSARNLRDWAMLGELVDRGIELHFAHESIDLQSRGGRLSADIQAVVAADYVRNLREEVRKGFYGRLKQGYYPLRAPIGYLDNGKAKSKTIDPLRGPLVAKAFELYATGDWSIYTLRDEMHKRGLRSRVGRRLSRHGIATILNNSFYVGIIRIDKTGETFQGLHQPLIAKSLFDRVRSMLNSRAPHKASRHRFRYQRMLRCAVCGYTLVASRHKGHVYYRCTTRTCPTTCVREELIDGQLGKAGALLRFSEAELQAVSIDIERVIQHMKVDRAEEARVMDLATAAVDERIGRLTDAYIDRLIERDAYLERKESLLAQRADICAQKADVDAGNDRYGERVRKILEQVKSLQSLPELGNDDNLREILKEVTSNLAVAEKELVISWESPFRELAKTEPVPLGGPYRTKARTGKERLQRLVQAIVDHCIADPSDAQRREKASIQSHTAKAA